MKNLRKILGIMCAAIMTASVAGCSGGETATTTAGGAADGTTTAATTAAAKNFDTSKEIGVISREDGSGTRGAFIELFGIEKKNDAGEKIDYTTQNAVITDKTSVMMTTVSGDLYSIGYISLGSLNETVKAVKIDGAEASTENVSNGSYKISRPFNIAVKEGLSDVAQDFIDYIMSADGQAVIEANGYIKVSDAPEYKSTGKTGKIVVGGSSSVTPVMEKLKEAYCAINTGVTIEVQQSDSSTGMSNAIDGICDIGMASRDLKDSEKEKGLTATVIAMDGIAVIVNNDNPTTDLTSEQVQKIFTGETTTWNEVTK